MSGTVSLLPEGQWLAVSNVRVPTQLAVLPWQAAGRSFTPTGGSPRWRRVYVCCFSNAGTAYVDGPRDPATGARP